MSNDAENHDNAGIPVMESCIIDNDLLSMISVAFPMRKRFNTERLTLSEQIRRETRARQIKTFKTRLKMGCSFNIYQSAWMVEPMSDRFWARFGFSNAT